MALGGFQAKVALEAHLRHQEEDNEDREEEEEGVIDMLSGASPVSESDSRQQARIDRALKASHDREEGTSTAMPPAIEGKATLPKAVLRDIRALYKKRIKRRSHYLDLFAFLLYSCLYLAILFLQRQSYSAYEVNFTMVNSFVPQDDGQPATAMGSTESIYLWLQGLLEDMWSDPVCGDGTCEFPYEFPSYGRFGCQADCGQLGTNEPDAAQLRIEIYADFSHYSSSLSATELMVKTTWNLCPVPGTAAHGLDCWFDSDQKFSSTLVDRTGTNAFTLSDVVPDGFAREEDVVGTGWELRVKGDIFHKVRGRVLDQRRYLLRETVLAKRDARDEQETSWDEQLAFFEDAREFFLQENLTDATLHDGDYYYEALTELKRAAPIAVKTAAVRIEKEVKNDNTTTIPYMLEFVNARAIEAEERIASERVSSNDARLCGVGKVVCTNAFLVDVRQLQAGQLPSVSDCDSAAFDCQEWSIENLPDEIVYVDSIPFPADDLEDLKAYALATGMTEYEVINHPNNWRGGRGEYLECSICDRIDGRENDEICRCQRGTMSPSNFCNCTLDVVQPHCLEYIATLPGYGGDTELRRRRLSGTMLGYVAAYDELSAFSAEASRVLRNSPDGPRRGLHAAALSALDDTLAAVTPLVAAEEGNSRRLLSLDDSAESAARVASTHGLHEDRAAVIGEVVTGVHDAVIEDAIAAHDTLAATLRQLSSEVDADAQGVGGRRSLLEESNVDDVLFALSGVSTQTEVLRRELDGLQDEVIAARTVAENAAADDTLLKTLNSGFSEIASGQDVLTNLLNEVLGKQTQATAVAAAAAAAQAEIAALSGAAASAELSVITKSEAQAQTFADALAIDRLTQEQYDIIIKELNARKWLELRKVQLAARPCSTTTRSFQFPLNKYISQRNYDRTDRMRKIGSTNRVVAGLLLHLTRYDEAKCSSDSFSNIVDTCLGGISREPFGTDPMFKRGTNLYNIELDNDESKAIYYNCTFQAELDGVPPTSEFYPLYGANISRGGERYREPFCPKLFNTKEVPYAFHYMPMDGFADGFPVFFDINLSEDGAMKYFTYVLEGLYLDDLAQKLTVQLVTYNGELEYFANARVQFSFKEGGTISVAYNVQTVKVTLYEDQIDWVRFGLEVALALGVVIAAFQESKEAVTTWRETGSLINHFKSVWNYIDALSIGLQIVALFIWWDFVLSKANTFECDLRYDVYKDLSSPARLLQYNYTNPIYLDSPATELAGTYGVDLERLVSMYAAINEMTQTQILYMTLNGVNIMLTLLRILKLMDFQPRMGVVTRSLGLAASDLGHFFILAIIIFIGYSMMAHLIFGYSIQKFSTLGLAINTCFEILLGEISVNEDLMRLNSLEKIPAVIFFWSYEILVFMILLNFLLAIIVDAFSDVKSQIEETQGLPGEVASYVGEGFAGLMHALNLGSKDYVADSTIVKQLEQWGGEEDEEDEEEEIERVLNVGEESLELYELQQLLSTAADSVSEAEGAALGALDANQLESVATAIIARFGEEVDHEEAERRRKKELKQRSREALVDNLAAVLDGQEKILKKLAEGQRIHKEMNRR